MSKDSNNDIVTRSTNWLSVVLAFASASGIVLALLGYGVALSMGSRFAMPHTFTFSSPLDLFTLGSWAVAQFLAESASWSQWEFYRSLLFFSARAIWPATILLAIGFVLVWIWLSASRRLTVEARRRSIRAFALRLKRKVCREPGLLSGAGCLVSTLAISFAIPFTAFAITALTIVFCTMLAVLPALGLTVGKAYIDEWVIGPDGCSQTRTRAERLSAGDSASEKSAASCLAVTRSDGAVVKGRMVFSTSNSVVLFDPFTGDVQRVGIEGSKVTVIGKLED